jgi:hypothetical protein
MRTSPARVAREDKANTRGGDRQVEHGKMGQRAAIGGDRRSGACTWGRATGRRG